MTDSIEVPDGYSFVRIINSGGFGTVVEMIEKSTGTHYAGKIVQCLTQKHKDRFDREVGRLKTFSHPRITKLKESVTMESDRVMVMELGGKSLADVVRDYSERNILMPREEVYRVMDDLVCVLEMMHEHESGRTAHGDIKMENILMDSDGHVKLCDFGAAESEDVTATSSAMSQLYVSPERMDSETGKATCEADVWSLGVILFWLLFGEPPFTSKNPSQLIRAISSFKATSIKNTCGDEERTLLMRLLDPVCPRSSLIFAFLSPLCVRLRQSKALRCLVNTIDGVWKLQDDTESLQSAELAEKISTLSEQLGEAQKGKEKCEQEIASLKSHYSELRQRLANICIYFGTDSLKTFDETAHMLAPTTLTHIIDPTEEYPWRTAFTIQINEGEWELKVRRSEQTGVNVMLSFLKHPLPDKATQFHCGSYLDGIGGDFFLWDGRMWHAGKEFKPVGTNKKCDRVGQTAAIRVNMSTREARLFVDDEEQPGIFTDIPSPLCLAISTGCQNEQIEVLHLARTDVMNQLNLLFASQNEFNSALRRIQSASQMGNRKVTLPGDISIETVMQVFAALTIDQLRESFFVMIEGTSAIDANHGVGAWYFTKLVERLMDPEDQHLFVVDGHSDGRMMIANESQTRSLEFLEKYRFVGVVVGKMLLEGIPVPFRFNEFIWKQLRGDAAVASDLSLANPNLATGLSELLSFSDDELTELELHWTITLPDGTSTELIPEGEERVLCHSDLTLFHELAAGAVLQWFSPQLMAMRAGLTSLVPPDVLRMISPKELEFTVCGEDTIDVAKWKQMTKNTAPIQLRPKVASAFWTVVETSTDDVRREIIRLACGTTSLRVLPLHGRQSFTLHILQTDGYLLPKAKTCFNRLDIPNVSDVDMMRTLILLAIKKRALPNDD
ncbi:putative Carbon catabolite-derepressing protein kinase [Blattamonas nauphoetae]|uniref:HECT-type E3 ubiquitin transferase n=1 Tax=Blattamonas nauphoetae TaxID=2049346 RepID=A0ABQ9YJJ4_9EUKA|nr:putative Carbon catabolite-derepressing protein kinase [Blattamonas nauphoetae]